MVPRHFSLPVGIAELPSPSRVIPELTQKATLELVAAEFGLPNCDVHSPEELSNRLRSEAALPEGPGKLKYRIQETVERDPRSLPSLAQSVTAANSGPMRKLGDG